MPPNTFSHTLFLSHPLSHTFLLLFTSSHIPSHSYHAPFTQGAMFSPTPPPKVAMPPPPPDEPSLAPHPPPTQRWWSPAAAGAPMPHPRAEWAPPAPPRGDPCRPPPSAAKKTDSPPPPRSTPKEERGRKIKEGCRRIAGAEGGRSLRKRRKRMILRKAR